MSCGEPKQTPTLKRSQRIPCCGMWFTHNLFRSSRNTNLRYKQESLSHSLTLQHMYGRTQRQQVQQRTFTNGQLHTVSKVKTIYGLHDNHPVPDGLLADRPAGISDELFSEYFVSSISRANTHPGHYFMDHLFRSLHNAICVTASATLPVWVDWTEDRRYRETRNVCVSVLWDLVCASCTLTLGSSERHQIFRVWVGQGCGGHI